MFFWGGAGECFSSFKKMIHSCLNSSFNLRCEKNDGLPLDGTQYRFHRRLCISDVLVSLSLSTRFQQQKQRFQAQRGQSPGGWGQCGNIVTLHRQPGEGPPLGVMSLEPRKKTLAVNPRRLSPELTPASSHSHRGYFSTGQVNGSGRLPFGNAGRHPVLTSRPVYRVYSSIFGRRNQRGVLTAMQRESRCVPASRFGIIIPQTGGEGSLFFF